MVILTLAGVVGVLIWAYLLLAHGGFWRVKGKLAPSVAPAPATRVAVIIPARNEAAVIAQSIGSLLEQAGESLHVFLVDDASSDGTAEIARQAAATLGKSGSLIQQQMSTLWQCQSTKKLEFSQVKQL